MNLAQRLNPEKDALAAAWRAKRLWLLQIPGNGLLLGLGYAWLWIPDERVWQVGVSALLGLTWLVGALWLQAGTWAFFQESSSGGDVPLGTVFHGVPRRLPAVLVWVLAFLGVLWLALEVTASVPFVAAWGGSALTLFFQRPISPNAVGKVLSVLVWLLSWGLVPLLLLPVGMRVASLGFSGFAFHSLKEAWRITQRRRLWADYAVLFAAGLYFPYRLVWWVPGLDTILSQGLSLLVRFLPAYVLAVTAWFVLASLLGRLGRGTREE